MKLRNKYTNWIFSKWTNLVFGLFFLCTGLFFFTGENYDGVIAYFYLTMGLANLLMFWLKKRGEGRGA